MKQIGFLGLGVMGLPMAKNLVKKAGCPVLGYDVLPGQMESFQAAGGVAVENPLEIYQSCDIIFQILPTHPLGAGNPIRKSGQNCSGPVLYRAGYHPGSFSKSAGRRDLLGGRPCQRRKPHG